MDETKIDGPKSPSPTHRPEWAFVVVFLLILTLAKLLLLPSSVYRSTDFDVHRNWLAVTRNLPPSQWYYDDVNGTTVHTLDYPPLFAHFEALLSRNPVTSALLDRGLLDARCLELFGDHENDPSEACVAFHRLTVILADVVLYVGAYFASTSVLLGGVGNASGNAGGGGGVAPEYGAMVSAALIVLNPGLLLLDHIHFQYNGMLLGLLLLSIGCIARGARLAPGTWDGVRWDFAGAVLYAALLTMKHLYLTLAPLYFFYLLRHCCFEAKRVEDPESGGTLSQQQRGQLAVANSFSVKKFFALASATVVTLALPFVPFFLVGPPGPTEQIGQMLRRLFPFQRGLCHDYWAANVWALYLFGEKVIGFALRRVGVLDVGLTDVPPSVAALCLLVGLVPAMIYAWKAASAMLERSSSKLSSETALQQSSFFAHAVVFCSFSGFMLAYHVHEKAIMTAIIPLTLLATQSREHAQLYLRACALGHFGLLPLLFRPAELAFKATSYIAFLGLAVLLLESTVTGDSQGISWLVATDDPPCGLITKWDRLGFVALALVFMFIEVVHPMFLRSNEKLEFLPLMITSVVCAVGLFGCWSHAFALMRRNVHHKPSDPVAVAARGKKKTL